MRKTILVFINYYLPGYKSGGPIQTISNMVGHLGNDYDFKIVTLDRDATDSEPYSNIEVEEWNKVGKAKVYYISKKNCTFAKLVKLIRQTPHDILYLNSFFNPVYTLYPLLGRRANLISKKPVVIAPRGELSDGALSIKRWKKKLGILLFKTLRLYADVQWHVSSKFEEEEVKKVMDVNNQDIYIAPNLPALPSENNNDWHLKRKNQLKILFLSRISPKKNLRYALEMLEDIEIDLVFDIVGPVRDQQYWKKCKDKIKKIPSNITVNYKGSVPHDKVSSVMAASDLFFLPTKNENFGHVILEAALAGTPLLISDTTPWKNLEEKSVGWEIPLSNKAEFISRIIEVYNMSQPEFHEFRLRVKKWAESIRSDENNIKKNKNMFNQVVN